MTADFSYSLEALERRWQLDKTPQVGLRLAEEYRRSEDFAAAIATLGAGLDVYPTHTSTRVALSRYLVDADRFSEAVPHLEQIVSLDPTHLVANKLLVEAYAGVGRVEEARDKLAIYEMMGEGDADIERLRDLIETASQEAVVAGEASSTQPAVDHPSDLEAISESSTDLRPGESENGIKAEADAEADSERNVETDPQTDGEPEPAAAPEGAGRSRDPNAGLTPGVRGDVGAEPAEAAPFEVGASEPPLEVSARDSRSTLGDSGAESEEPFGTPSDAVSTSSYWRGVAGEGIFSFEEAPAGAPVTLAPAEGRGRPSVPWVSPVSEEAEEIFPTADLADSTPPDVARDARTVGGSTVTLAKLYLEQGHREKAIETFRDVLEREPGNREVLGELDLLGASPGREGEPASTSAQRRREVLTAYRARLRRAVAAGL